MDLICYSHLRWDFVYQRPQHLMSRFAQQFRVFYIEEPIFDTNDPFLETTFTSENVWRVIMHLPEHMRGREEAHFMMMKRLVLQFDIEKHIAWYYTPMAFFEDAIQSPLLIIYDCMDELSAFKNAPLELKVREIVLMKRADIVFTGGYKLYNAKKHLHKNIHPFPSSIDKAHFMKARNAGEDPADQINIPHPRIGFFGVIDERMDIELLREISSQRPDWQLVIIGPVVKIDPSLLPVNRNIHYLGIKSYAELPDYLRGWDVAILPFALNESTKYISPTKTPEYLAGGIPVVSTAIHDVIHPYGESSMVYIGDNATHFIECIEQALTRLDKNTWLKTVDAYLDESSWNKTWDKMMFLINEAMEKKLSNDPITRKGIYYV